MQEDECVEAAGVWRRVGGGHSVPCEQLVQTADGHHSLTTAWCLSNGQLQTHEWRVESLSSQEMSLSCSTPSLVLVGNQLCSAWGFVPVWSTGVISPFADCTAALPPALLCSCSREFAEVTMRGQPRYRDSQTHLSPLQRAE